MSSRLHTATPQPQEDDRFIFSEEPLEDDGWFQGGPGSLLGPDSRFKVEANLGWGTTSSLWLARDLRKDRYVALKILSSFASQLNREDELQELKVLQHLSSDTVTSSPLPVDPSGSFSRLLTHFYHQGIKDDGEHLCLVMDLLGPSMRGLRDGLPNFGYLPLPIVKRMLRDVLIGIAHAHSRGVAHTDINSDNIMITLSDKWTTEAITEWLKTNPPRTHPPEQSVTKMISAFVSQSLPPPTVSELAVGKYTLADWGSAQLVNSQITDDITPLGLRPPEIILGGKWDESVDIWTFGCITFDALTMYPLFEPMFEPIDYEMESVSEKAMLLYQMTAFCGEFFEKELLTRCSRSQDYFNIDCSLKGFDRFFRKSFKDCIRSCKVLFSDEEIERAAAFMHRCLRLDPKNRATARDLLEDPWLLS